MDAKMNSELLEIQPQELRIIFELKKQSSCSIQLANNSDYHVAFKVKTTSASKYCVRPNTGVIKPNLTCDITVTMEAQEVAPPDLICNDKFLIQSTIVLNWTTTDHITSATFAKEVGKYIEEKKLKVSLMSPPRIRPHNTTTESNDLVQNNNSHAKVGEVNKEVADAMKNEQSINTKHSEELRLSNDVEEIKSKLKEFESILKQDNLTINKNTRTREIGFQILFVSVVALVGIYLGYLLHN